MLSRMTIRDLELMASIWQAVGGEPAALARVDFSGSEQQLPSVYAVSALASASVGAATLAAAELLRVRGGGPRRTVHVDRRHAAVAFRSERYLTPLGWELPPVWDPIAGDYETRDGFIRLHTNYKHHRAAVLRALDVPEDRDAVARAVRDWTADALESAVVREGGAAAALRTAEEFAAHAQGRALSAEPLFAVDRRAAPALQLERAERPLSGVRVLDLTRVIAGPVCTRFLAAHGADVLRVDPPGFEEVGALLAETTIGKRRTFLDLKRETDRRTFEQLIGRAHVLVHGYRSDALDRLGFDEAFRKRLNPSLVSIALDAYGFSGPWATRRGFDSLVQMSTGIAAKGREVAKARRPFPLPAQALDHGAGYLLAAAACHALSRLVSDGQVSRVRTSLARTARLLMELGDDGDPRAPDLTESDAAPYLERAETPWGDVKRVRCPGAIDGAAPYWTLPAGPLGSDPPEW